MDQQLNFDFIEKPKKNLGRVLTLKVKITDPSKADWIWNIDNNPDLGVHIYGLTNGDVIARELFLEEELHKIEHKYEPLQEILDRHEEMQFDKRG
ncbi:hypothetical protein N9948_01860 [bacterium]|nr:hypothetical protein [bacterium]